MGGAEGAGPGANPLDELEEQCRLHGERFPLMAARLSYMHVTDVVRRRLAARGLLPSPPADCTRSAQGGGAGGGGGGLCSAYGTAYGSSGCSAYGCSTPSSSSPGGASEPTLADSLKALQRLQHEGVGAGAGAGAGTPGSDAGSTGAADGRGGLLPLRGDPLTSLHVLCFANVPPPYPPHWVEQHGLAAAALRRLAADPAAVGAAAAALLAAEAAAGRKQQRGALADEALVQELCAAVAGAAGALDAGWFVSVLARLHLNVFQVGVGGAVRDAGVMPEVDRNKQVGMRVGEWRQGWSWCAGPLVTGPRLCPRGKQTECGGRAQSTRTSCISGMHPAALQ